MKLPQPQRRDRGEPIAPLINVVFLLLIFFLMAATLAPPEPLEVTPPRSVSEAEQAGGMALVIAADGTLAYGDLRGEAVFGALGAGPLTVRADAALPAARLVGVLGRLRAAGADGIELVVEAR